MNPTQFMNNCTQYIQQLIDSAISQYPDPQSLAGHPQILDQVLNFYRTRDLCYTFLINPQLRSVGHTFNQLSPQQQNNFFQLYSPGELVDFFNKPNVLNDFIAENELGQKNWFQNDHTYQMAYQTMIKPL